MVVGALGAVFGVASSLINRGVSYYEKKQEIAVEEKRQEHLLAIANITAQKGVSIAEIKSTADSLAASYVHDASMGKASKWVVNIKQLMRPGITFYVLVLVTILWFTLPTDFVAARKLIIITALETLTMTISWWFADRSLSKKDNN
jgi:hypothetical protein